MVPTNRRNSLGNTMQEGGQAASLRDGKKINELKSRYDLRNPDIALEVYEELAADPYYFESEIGRDFQKSLLRIAIHSEQYLSDDSMVSGRKKGEKRKVVNKAEQELIDGLFPVSDKAREHDSHRRPVSKSHESKKKRENHIEFKDKRLSQDKQDTVQKPRKPRSKAKLRFIIGLIAILSMILCYQLYEIISYQIKSYLSEKKIEDLINCILTPYDRTVSEEHRYDDMIISGLDPSQDGSNSTDEEEIQQEDTDILYKYSVLYKRNPDMIGWINIDDTIINYPIMQTKNDEEYYLLRDFDQNEDINGLPFMDARCDVLNNDGNLIIYGHNMKNGSMFSSLLDYEDYAFYQDHRSIMFDTIYEEGIYDIIAVFQTRVAYQDEEMFRYYEMFDADNEEEFNRYIDEIKQISLYDISDTAVYKDKLLTLSTCDRRIENGRFVVVARKR